MALGVVVAHVNLAWFPGAMIMMESFFVISGFLITTIIWRFTEKTGEFNLVNFWKRRLMRLYPVLILVIFCSVVASIFIVDDMRPVFADALATLLYYSNWTKLYNYHYPTIFGQSWSLSIEEQFYLIWPLLFFLSFKLNLGLKRTVLLLSSIGVICMIWKYYLIDQGAPWSRLYYALDSRMDAFVFGGILAMVYPRIISLCLSDAGRFVLNASVVAYVILLTVSTPREMSYFYWQQSLSLLISALLVLLLVIPSKGVAQRIFSSKLSVFLGQRCYSIYLWHWPLIWLLMIKYSPGKFELLAIVIPAVLILSSLSYRFVELPFMSRRRGV
jgi:peptidoglycan/LPS O-acetylase OafA/YrhL